MTLLLKAGFGRGGAARPWAWRGPSRVLRAALLLSVRVFGRSSVLYTPFPVAITCMMCTYNALRFVLAMFCFTMPGLFLYLQIENYYRPIYRIL